ncbi:uncharacterized protein LOC130429615 [Triplophysa dalaica]|uniref:uncharacterized protein LOC130429615 n=1 Tax=Triplophysa dalaica TaxID=1582913 RepID=UPI0024DFBED5|nr:uncharacterized protein LOC130429615 [Triplophysa dalaica]XP_056614254.1 uncharacterized protein LOC130429615 [Triplophysa dalaica]XP_056614255.1 uncharacterized protein LOC130429615 [Triplophysa dalaica]
MMMSLLPLCVMLLQIIIQGVFAADTDEVKTITVMEGDSVTLHTNLTQIQRDDHILWRLKNNNGVTLLAEVYKRYNVNRIYDDIDSGRLRDRLNLDNQTGSLTITNISTAYSTLYTLEMINSDGTLYSKFSVIVSRLPVPFISRNASNCSSPSKRSSVSKCGPVIGEDHTAVIVIVAAFAVMVLVAVAVIAVIAFKRHKQAGQDVQEKEMKLMNNNDMSRDGDEVSVLLAASNGVSHESNVPVSSLVEQCAGNLKGLEDTRAET